MKLFASLIVSFSLLATLSSCGSDDSQGKSSVKADDGDYELIIVKPQPKDEIIRCPHKQFKCPPKGV